MADETEVEAREPSEHEKVLSNVESHFRRIGFNEWQAAELADLGIDWHDAERLLKRGCSHEHAIDILT